VLKHIEASKTLYEEVESTDIQAPYPTISLGLSTKLYQCWKLQLTSEHGKQVHATMNRLQYLQKEITDLKKNLDKDLQIYKTSPKPNSGLDQKTALIALQSNSLNLLLTEYQKLLDWAVQNNLVRIAEKGLWRARRTISPKLKDDDYTMVYDPLAPECAPNPKK
jgi:hypothetical protein